MTDYISREAAIELLSQPITMSMCLSTEECHHKIAQQRIDRYLVENIPAADVRPVVRGKFEYRGQKVIDDLFPTYACSNCHGVIPADWKRKCNFCPNCGADMREES